MTRTSSKLKIKGYSIKYMTNTHQNVQGHEKQWVKKD